MYCRRIRINNERLYYCVILYSENQLTLVYEGDQSQRFLQIIAKYDSELVNIHHAKFAIKLDEREISVIIRYIV